MKLTKAVLAKLHIYNSWGVAQATGQKVFISYKPAESRRLASHFAYWSIIRLAGTGYYHKDLTVTHREVKELVLQQAIALVKKQYKLNITDKDVFGGYHPEGTLRKLEVMASII